MTKWEQRTPNFLSTIFECISKIEEVIKLELEDLEDKYKKIEMLEKLRKEAKIE